MQISWHDTPHASKKNSTEEIILSADDAFSEGFLAENGALIRALSIEVPSLESVFLTLTGREIRDTLATGREQTKAFGKIGGEHTG